MIKKFIMGFIGMISAGAWYILKTTFEGYWYLIPWTILIVCLFYPDKTQPKRERGE